MDQLQVDALHKIVTGDITKASLGLASSGLQALFLPWQTIPACLNAAKLIKSTSRLHQLEKTVKASSGLRLRKRATVRGIIRGAVVKGVTIVLFVGHDDVLGIFDQATGLMSYLRANDGGGSEGVTSSMRDYFDSWDQDHRMGHPVIEGTTAVASLPAETIQDMLGLDTASDQGLSHTGWHAGEGPWCNKSLLLAQLRSRLKSSLRRLSNMRFKDVRRGNLAIGIEKVHPTRVITSSLAPLQREQ